MQHSISPHGQMGDPTYDVLPQRNFTSPPNMHPNQQMMGGPQMGGPPGQMMGSQMGSHQHLNDPR